MLVQVTLDGSNSDLLNFLISLSKTPVWCHSFINKTEQFYSTSVEVFNLFSQELGPFSHITLFLLLIFLSPDSPVFIPVNPHDLRGRLPIFWPVSRMR